MYLKRNDMLATLGLYLGDYTKQFYLREISKITGIPLKTTQNIVLGLENNKILLSTVRGKNKYFRLNTDNAQTKFYLLQAEIYRTLLFMQKYPLFKTFMKNLNTNAAIIVFGSFAKFSADKDSDLDLLIISKDEEKLPFHLLPYKVHEVRIPEESFEKASEKRETLLKEIEENHIILNNHSFYVNSIWDYYGKQ